MTPAPGFAKSRSLNHFKAPAPGPPRLETVPGPGPAGPGQPEWQPGPTDCRRGRRGGGGGPGPGPRRPCIQVMFPAAARRQPGSSSSGPCPGRPQWQQPGPPPHCRRALAAAPALAGRADSRAQEFNAGDVCLRARLVTTVNFKLTRTPVESPAAVWRQLILRLPKTHNDANPGHSLSEFARLSTRL